MIDLGESDARKTVPQSRSDRDPVFDQFREKLQGLTTADWDAILESKERGMLTVEVYKRDRRTHKGERLVAKVDHSTADSGALHEVYARKYPSSQGFRFHVYATYVTRRNAITGAEYQERYDTPLSASPSSETYWQS